MDLYIQIGVMLVLLTAFSMVVYYYYYTIDMSMDIEKSIEEPLMVYNSDNTITKPTFKIDGRIFFQWAKNVKEQRDLYIVYPASIAPDPSKLGEHMKYAKVNINTQYPSSSTVDFLDPFDTTTTNAILYSEGDKVVDNYVRGYGEEAVRIGTNGLVTVYTFTEPTSGKLIYVSIIE